MSDLLDGDLEALCDMTENDINEAVTSYGKRNDGVFPIRFTQVQRKRLIALVLWTKDMRRANLPVEFENVTDRAGFVETISNAFERNNRRKEQKKIGESFHDATFNHKLRGQAQWEKFVEEFDATLAMIVGIGGTPLSYVTRENETSVYDDTQTYDDAIINATSLAGPNFKIDAQTVHQLILKNVTEDSDAYTYIKPLMKYRNGRKDILALRERYSNVATKQALINMAKQTLSNLRYKNERNFSFEKFSAKLQKAYDDLADNGRPVNNNDIVDDLWDRIQVDQLQMFTASLKIEFRKNPKPYREVLQDYATEVTSVYKSTPNNQGGRNISATYTKKGPAPESGVYTSDGSFYIGDYEKSQWSHSSVVPHHHEIRNARRNGNDGGERTTQHQNQKPKYGNKKWQNNKLNKNKKQLSKLKAQIAAAKIQLGDSNKRKDDSNNNQDENNHAGDSFGGKKSKTS